MLGSTGSGVRRPPCLEGPVTVLGWSEGTAHHLAEMEDQPDTTWSRPTIARERERGGNGSMSGPADIDPALSVSQWNWWKPRGQLSSIAPPFIQQQHGTARSPPYSTEASSSAKRSQERGRPHRSNAGRPGGFTSLATELRNRILDLTDTCSFDLKKPGTQRYVYKCI